METAAEVEGAAQAAAEVTTQKEFPAIVASNIVIVDSCCDEMIISKVTSINSIDMLYSPTGGNRQNC